MGSVAFLPSQPLYQGGNVADEVPGLYPVALDGRPFLIDLTDEFGFDSVDLLRDQADTSSEPAEQSLNPFGLWRRAQETWHKGAGQTHLDRPDSDRARFQTSKGVDVWTMWQASLLPDVEKQLTATGSNLKLVVVGSYLYVADGTNVKFTQNLTSWTTMTGLTGTITDLTSDGSNVYIANGSDIWQVAAGTTAAGSVWSSQDADLLGYLKGRLLAAHDNVWYDIDGAGTAVEVLAHPNSAFRWVGFGAGPGHIYAAGKAGDKSEIYRTSIKAAGTALDTAVVAARTPEGREVVTALGDYLEQFILIGTEAGWRTARANDSGDLTLLGLVETDSPVRCFEGQERFIWYGLTNYDASSTGLGRADLEQFNGTKPAYASDLMAGTAASSVQGAVLSVVTFGGNRVFAVSGVGVFEESDDLVGTATMDLGLIGFGLPDDKTAVYLDLLHEQLDGELAAAMSVDGGAFLSLGSSSTDDATAKTLNVGQKTGEKFEVRLTFTRDSEDATAGPTLTRVTLRAEPAAMQAYQYVVPIILDTQLTVARQTRPRDVEDDITFLKNLLGQIVTYQEGDVRLPAVKVAKVRVRRNQQVSGGGGGTETWAGKAWVLLKELV